MNAAAGILARSKLPYHLLVQDGEANVTRIQGKHNLLHSIDVGSANWWQTFLYLNYCR